MVRRFPSSVSTIEAQSDGWRTRIVETSTARPGRADGLVFAQAPCMHMKFDGGTILIAGLAPAIESSNLCALKWDARVGAYRGPAYLLRQMQNELRNLGHEIDAPPIKLQTPTLQPRQIRLRPYQEAALSAWEIAGHRGVLTLPTGSGKTILALEAVRRIARPTLILVPTRVLLQQWTSVFESVGGIQAGVLGDGSRDIQPVTIATFESAYRNMNWIGDRFDFLIVDEVHHFGRGARDEALEMSLASLRLGLTATTPREEEWQNRIGTLIGPIAYELNLDDLRGRYLADFDWIRIHLELNTEERLLYEKEMNAFRIVHEAFRAICPIGKWRDFVFYAARTENGRKGLQGLRQAQNILSFPKAKQEAIGAILSRHSNDKILLFTSDTATAYEVSRLHLIMPLTAEINRKEREDALSWFRRNEISALVSCQVLNEGLDVPEANVAIVIGGRRGEREHLQRIGRILRWKDGKKAKIYELVCNRTIEVRQADKRGRRLDSRIDSFT